MSFEYRTVGKDLHFEAEAEPGEDLHPDDRAVAEAHKAQGLAGSHAALDRAFSFVVLTATRDELGEAEAPPDGLTFAHSVEMFGCLDGSVAENAEFIYTVFEFMVEKCANVLGYPEVVSLAHMSGRWLSERDLLPE